VVKDDDALDAAVTLLQIWGRLKLALWWTKFDEVSSYRIVARWGAHLRFWGRGRWWFGLVVVAFSSDWWLMVRAIHGGSPTELKTKIGL
jgi:hypothetical protein